MQGLHGNPSILALPLPVDMYGLSDACVLWMMSIPCHVCRIRGLGLLSSAYSLDHHLVGLSSSGSLVAMILGSLRVLILHLVLLIYFCLLIFSKISAEGLSGCVFCPYKYYGILSSVMFRFKHVNFT